MVNIAGMYPDNEKRIAGLRISWVVYVRVWEKVRSHLERVLGSCTVANWNWNDTQAFHPLERNTSHTRQFLKASDAHSCVILLDLLPKMKLKIDTDTNDSYKQ